FDCWVADESIRHTPPRGRLAIAPAGADVLAIGEASLDAIFVRIDPARFALAAAEESGPSAQLIARMSSDDPELTRLAATLADETVRGYPRGALFWNELADRFVSGVADRHTTGGDTPRRGMLPENVLARVKDYINAHLEEPIEVATLARLAGRSPFHF